MPNKRYTGATFEEKASQYLKGLGYHILAQNVYSSYGEIDLLVQKENRISAVEVKYRKNPKVSIFEVIPQSKIKKIEKTLLYYLSKNKMKNNVDMGIDALLIEVIGNKESIHFIKNIHLDY